MRTKKLTYRKKRSENWGRIAREKPQRPTGTFYHELLSRHYRFMVPPGQDVLELGCGYGDLLAALAPASGVGLDFAPEMVEYARKRHPELCFVCADAHHIPLQKHFDVIILSDLINDLWDIQAVLENLPPLCHPGTRIILNFFNNLWRLPIVIARRCKLTIPFLEQNWLDPKDVNNLLYLSGLEPIRLAPRILFPVRFPLISRFANRILVKIPPFQWFRWSNFLVARPGPLPPAQPGRVASTVSLIIPARNEAGNIVPLLERLSMLPYRLELIFVEGHSWDTTYETIQKTIKRFPNLPCHLLKQTGTGKADAVKTGLHEATGDILVVMDADLTVQPEDIPRFIEALVSRKGEFINGVRLVYPLEERSMRFFNMAANKIFSLLFSWILGQPVKDTLCGTKALWKKDYHRIEQSRISWGASDPFGDFELLLGAARINLKIIDMPVRYQNRQYGRTNINRWNHGWALIKMTFIAICRLKLQ